MHNITISRSELDQLITANYMYIKDQCRFYCIKCGLSAELAEDLAHDLIIKIYDDINYNPTKGCFKTYLQNIIPNFLKNQKRKEKNHLCYDEELSEDDHVLYENEKAEMRIVLDTITEKLNDVEKQIIKLKLKGSTTKQIAAELNLSERTIKNIFSKIRKKFAPNTL